MRLRLGCGETREDAGHLPPQRRRQGRSADPPNEVTGPTRKSRAVGRTYPDAARAHSSHPDTLRADLHASQPQPAEAAADLPYRQAQVQHRREQHVAAGAGRAIDQKNHRAIKAARYPAPKPLSTFTTATPGEQLFSIARSGATPLKEAP